MKSRKKKHEVTQTEEATLQTVSYQTRGRSNGKLGKDLTLNQGSPKNYLESTSRRTRTQQTREPCLASTPVHSSYADRVPKILESPVEAKQETKQSVEVRTPLKRPENESQRSRSTAKTRRKGIRYQQPRQVPKRQTRAKTKGCSETSSLPAERRRGRKKKISTQATAVQPLGCARPRFNLDSPEEAEQDVSSELSIELSHYEEQPPSLSPLIHEDEESDEEDEEFPSFYLQAAKKPPPITEGVFVWHKLRSYPFWPALVKSVNRKQKKASVLLIDDSILSRNKGFTVALKSLKPFDTEEEKELECKAREKHEAAIKWSLDLITDYRMKIACGSFSGSFIEYFSHDMSFPVRRKYPQAASDRLTITSDDTIEFSDDPMEDSVIKPQEEVSRRSKRLLPDRSQAAYNRANEKLVHFIVKQHKADKHLLAVIRGQQESKWLCLFLSASRRRYVPVYLEDGHQSDQVYSYLNELYKTAVASTPCQTKLKNVEQVPFYVLDVLFPEAIIFAIAGVDKVSMEEAEKKFSTGRPISNRERQELDQMIERYMMRKSLPSNTNKQL